MHHKQPSLGFTTAEQWFPGRGRAFQTIWEALLHLPEVGSVDSMATPPVGADCCSSLVLPHLELGHWLFGCTSHGNIRRRFSLFTYSIVYLISEHTQVCWRKLEKCKKERVAERRGSQMAAVSLLKFTAEAARLAQPSNWALRQLNNDSAVVNGCTIAWPARNWQLFHNPHHKWWWCGSPATIGSKGKLVWWVGTVGPGEGGWMGGRQNGGLRGWILWSPVCARILSTFLCPPFLLLSTDLC